MPDDDPFLAAAKAYSPGGSSPGSDVSSLLGQMRGGEASQESGGNYRVRPNARTGAAGKYQVLPSNIPSWTQKHYHQMLTPEQFQANPKAQEAVFNGEMSDYLRQAKRANPSADDTTIKRMAAAAWYGGPGRMHRYDDPTVFRLGEPSFRDYTNGVVNGGSHRQSNHQVDDPFKAAANAYQPTPVEDPFKAAAKAYTPVAAPSPVPESPDTIAIQKQAALDPNVMARSAVLTTDPSQDHLFENDSNFQKVKAPEGVQGTLWVNTQKAAKLKLRTPEEIQHYVAVNPAAMMRLIGKPVAPVDDTSQGVSVHTTLPHPQTGQSLEASTTAVTNEKDAMKQRDADQHSFGHLGAVTTVIPTSQAVKNRLVGQGVDPASLAPVADDLGNSLPLPAGVDPNAPAPAKQITKSAVASKPKAPEQKKPVEQHGEKTDVTIGDENYDEQGNLLDKNLQPIPPRPVQQVKEGSDEQYKAVSDTITPPAGLDEKQANAYIQGQLKAKYGAGKFDNFQFLSGYHPGNSVDITYGALKDAGVDADGLIHQKVIDQRTETAGQKPAPLSGNETWAVNDARRWKEDYGDTAAEFLGELVGSASDINGMSGGVADFLNQWSPVMNASRSILTNDGQRRIHQTANDEGVVPEVRDQGVEDAKTAVEQGSAIRKATEVSTDPDAPWYQRVPTQVFHSVVKGAADIPKYSILSMFPGGFIGGMAIEAGGLKRIQGGSNAEVLKATMKGGLQGALLKFLPKGVQKVFGIAPEVEEGVVGAAATEPSTLRNLAQAGTELVSVGGGNFLLGKAFGDPDYDNFVNSVGLAVFHGYGMGKEGLKGLSGKIIHARDAKGDEVYAKVEGDKLVATDPQPADIEMVKPEGSKKLADSNAKAKEAGIPVPDKTVQAESKSDTPRTVTHPDPAINGKEVVAETADGRVVVPNDTNASGVSVVKDRATTGGVLEPPVETPSDFEQLPREQKEEVIRQSGKDVEEKDAEKPAIEQPEAPKATISLKDVVNKRGKQIFADEEAAKAAHAKESLKDHGETYDEYLKRKLCSEGPVAAYSNKGKKKSRK